MKKRSIWAIALIAILNASSAEAAQSSAEKLLDSLSVKGRAAKTGYTRDQFGQRWGIVDNRHGSWCVFWAGRERPDHYRFHFEI